MGVLANTSVFEREKCIGLDGGVYLVCHGYPARYFLNVSRICVLTGQQVKHSRVVATQQRKYTHSCSENHSYQSLTFALARIRENQEERERGILI